jgi:hypothetical protein
LIRGECSIVIDTTTSIAAVPIHLPHLPPLTVWALLTGSGFVVVLGTGVVAFWLDRRSRKAIRLARTAARAAEAAAAPLPLTAEEAAHELTTVREAAARAATTFAHARHDSDQAAQAVEEAERAYAAARAAHRAALQSKNVAVAATPVPTGAPATPVPTGAPADTERDVARAALGAYRRGDLSVEDLRRVWYGASGWDATSDAAEHEILRLGAEEMAARQEYHRALAAAQSARRAEYLADTAARALAAEAVTAASELGTAWRPPSPRTPGRSRASAARGRRSG